MTQSDISAEAAPEALRATRGLVFDIQKFSLHDGPGIRTTVFMKGCPLRCIWCHNPESQRAAPEILFTPAKCIGCGWCFANCPNGCHAASADGSHSFNRGACVRCGKCVNNCPTDSLSFTCTKKKQKTL